MGHILPLPRWQGQLPSLVQTTGPDKAPSAWPLHSREGCSRRQQASQRTHLRASGLVTVLGLGLASSSGQGPRTVLRTEPSHALSLNHTDTCRRQGRAHLLCEGGTLFCLGFDLGFSVSGGTWEELLSESLFGRGTDGSAETAGGRVLVGYGNNITES